MGNARAGAETIPLNRSASALKSHPRTIQAVINVGNAVRARAENRVTQRASNW